MKDRMRQKAFIFSRNLSARRAFKSPSSFYRNCASAFSFLAGVHTVYMDIVTFISHYNVLYAVWSWKRITEDGIYVSVTNRFEENKPSYYSKYTNVKSFVNPRIFPNNMHCLLNVRKMSIG